MVNTVADASAAELKVFPNPNKGIFTMNLVSGSNEQVTVVITDAAGRIVKEFSTVTNKATEIKMDNAAGIYLLKVSAGNNNYIQKIIVE
jgi:trimeric autotransporter adhesin